MSLITGETQCPFCRNTVRYYLIVPACAEERSAYVVSAWCACCKRLVRRLYDVRTGTLR